jgi:hypothetical protein
MPLGSQYRKQQRARRISCYFRYFPFDGIVWLNIDENFRFIPTVGAGGLPRYFFSGLLSAFTCRSLFPGFFFDGFKGTGDNHFSLIAAFFAGTYLSECFLGGLFCHLLFSPFNSYLSEINDGKSANNCQILNLTYMPSI